MTPNPPTSLPQPTPLRELCKRATPGPWGYDLNHTVGRHEGGEWMESVVQLPAGVHRRRPTKTEKADCLLISRCSPDVILKAYETLEEVSHALQAIPIPLDSVYWNYRQKQVGQVRATINLLDGRSTP